MTCVECGSLSGHDVELVDAYGAVTHECVLCIRCIDRKNREGKKLAQREQVRWS